MVLKQAEFYNTNKKRYALARKFIEGAVDNMRKVTGYYQKKNINLVNLHSNIDNLCSKIGEQNNINELMAIEGNIRGYYYNSFNKILKGKVFEFKERTKRPPKDRLNALISFGNSLLYTVVLSEIYKTHLDPRIGYLHTTNFRRFSLNLDVAEIFKPIIIDRIIISLVNKKALQKKHFDDSLNKVYLNEKGRQIFIEEFDKRLKQTIKYKNIKKRVSYRRLIRMELYKLEKHLLGENEYTPYLSHW